MTVENSSFGNFRNVASKSGNHKSSVVPVGLLQDLKSNNPIPITIGGTSGRTFTVNASVTRPVRMWNGNDYFTLNESLAYSWTGAATDAVIDSTGALSTASTATGVYYFYVSLSTDGTLLLRPSATAPVAAQGEFANGIYTHPGTSKAQYWNYVGYQVNTTASTAPVFTAAVKIGFTYHHSPALATAIYGASTGMKAIDFTAVLPTHFVKPAGYYTGAAVVGDFIAIGPSTGLNVGLADRNYHPVTTAYGGDWGGKYQVSGGTVYWNGTGTEAIVGAVTSVEDVV